MTSESKEASNKLDEHWVTRTIQLFATLWLILLFLGSLFLVIFFGLNPLNWGWLLAYFIFIYFDPAPENGGRRIAWVYNGPLFKYIRNYFQMKLVKSTDLDPAKNYIFGYHPHGIISYGGQTIFRTDNPEFVEQFPGLNVTTLSVNFNFTMPFHREVGLALGFASVSKKSILNILKPGNGRSVMIVVGGGAEALYSREDVAKLLLKKRLGFVKLAIKTGAHLVPVYGFGETSTFTLTDIFERPILSWIQPLLQKLGMRAAFFYGRGFTEGSVGPFAYRKPITAVVGKPVVIERKDNPTDEEVAKAHQQYLDNLKDIYDKHKDQYHTGSLPAPELEFV